MQVYIIYMNITLKNYPIGDHRETYQIVLLQPNDSSFSCYLPCWLGAQSWTPYLGLFLPSLFLFLSLIVHRNLQKKVNHRQKENIFILIEGPFFHFSNTKFTLLYNILP